MLADCSSVMKAIVSYGSRASGADHAFGPDGGRAGIRRLARFRGARLLSDDGQGGKLLPAAFAALLFAGIYAADADDRPAFRPDETIVFQIPSQSLAAALQAYGQATGIQVLYESNSAVGRTSVEVEGKFTADAALNLLLKGTELRVRYIRPDAITLALPTAEVVSRAPPAMPLAASDLSLGTLRVRGSGGNDARLQDYSQGVQMDIQNALRKNPRTRDGNYRAVLDLWIDPARTIERTELFRSTGDRERDAAVAATLRGVTISRPAPANTPQPVRVGIVVNSLQ